MSFDPTFGDFLLAIVAMSALIILLKPRPVRRRPRRANRRSTRRRWINNLNGEWDYWEGERHR